MLRSIFTSFVFLGLIYNSHGLNVQGKVIFPAGGEPDSLDSNSWLTVKVEDTSMMDAPSVVLGKDVKEITNYQPGEPITFQVNDITVPGSTNSISISAVLNVGWKASGSDWIHSNDYFTDTHTSIEHPANQQSVVKDVPVVKYN